MNYNDYAKYIEQAIPSTFTNVYIIDMMSDLVMDFAFENDTFTCKNTTPFTTFFSSLETIIHPEDLKGYMDSISVNPAQSTSESDEYVRYEYRKKLDSGEYNWYTNTIKTIEVDQKKLSLVLVEDINNNSGAKEHSATTAANDQKQQQLAIDAVVNAITKINGVMNINSTSDNPELKSLTGYIDNVLVDLANTVPAINTKLTENMITSTNQGKEKTVLIVDDDHMTSKLLVRTFEDMYKILVAYNGQEAIDILEKNNDATNLDEKDNIVGIFLDLNMPVVDGFGVLDYMSAKNLISKIPVIIISGDYDAETKERSYTYPIADVLEKPFNVQVVKHRIKTLVKLYKSNNSLNEIILTQHQDLKNVINTIVKSYLYDYSFEIKNVCNYTKILAKQVSDDYDEYNFDENKLNKLEEAVKYYDVGLYTLPHKMFRKPSFNEDEIKVIKSHPVIGTTIFDTVLRQNGDSIFNNYARDIIEYHEERHDGTGYPHSLQGEHIPVVAQIASVALEYNSLIKSMDEATVLDEIVKKSGTKFNPKIVDSLKKCVEEFKKVTNK